MHAFFPAVLMVVFALGIAVGCYLYPLLLVLARRLFARMGHPLIGFTPALLVLFLPAIALAQELPGTAATPAASSLLDQYLPKILELVLTGLLIPLLLKAKSWLSSTADSKDASAGKQAFARLMLPIEHLAEVFAAAYQHSLETNPTADKKVLLQEAADSLKSTLGSDGLAALQGELGFGGEALAKYFQGMIAQKLATKQLTAATAAGVAAGQKVQALPLNQVAAQLAQA